MNQTLKKLKKLTEHIPKSESDYAKEIRKVLATLIDEVEKGGSRKRMLQIISKFRKELGISTEAFTKAFNIEMVNDVSSMWFEVDRASIEQLLKFQEIYMINSSGASVAVNVNDLLKSMSGKLYKDVRSIVIGGYSTGVHPKEIANELTKRLGKQRKKKYSTDRHNLRTIVTTMYADASNLAQMQMLKDNQDIYEYYEYVSKLDTRTTEICRHLDERKWYSFDDIPKKYFPPLHYRCRSIIVGVVNDDISVDRIENLKDGSLRTY